MKFSILSLLVILCNACFSKQNEVVYIEPYSEREVVFDIDKKTVRILDMENKLEKCNDAKFYCINSEVFYFAIPKSIPMDIGSAWEYRNEFKIVKAKELMLFNEKLDVLLIKSITKDGSILFVYSDKFGLISFSNLNKKDGLENVFYLSKGNGNFFKVLDH